jgi:malate synthase
MHSASSRILTPAAKEFLTHLHVTFEKERQHLLEARRARALRLSQGEKPHFLPETANIRESTWSVAPAPSDLNDRRVEITGPVDAKMVINALNSGAKVFMADFEDSNAPTWHNTIEGQENLLRANLRTLSFTSPEGKSYSLKDSLATLVVRPRGWHLSEKHFEIDGVPISGSLFDFGLYLFHNHSPLAARGSGPYFYLPKLESHLEARLWNSVFIEAQRYLGIPRGTIRATVLIETILAAFEMEEILFELKEHAAGLNAGRWDYIFSIIKKCHGWPGFTLPDRSQITMTVPFMRAYTELLVKTCHSRGAHAMGGMAAFIPSRKDPEVNEQALGKVREDKQRESQDGFDGTWVAHPDLVPIAMEVFDKALSVNPHQKQRLRDEVRVTPEALLAFSVPNGTVSEAGIRNNMSVCLQYLSAWLRGSGAVAIFNLMEDAATAEISRSQLWLWRTRSIKTLEGSTCTAAWFRTLLQEECAKLENLPRLSDARALFEKLIFSDTFEEFLTLPAYRMLSESVP